MVQILKIVTNELEQNCYLLHDEFDRGVIIDPGDNAAKIIQTIEDRCLRMDAVLATHAHFDHVGAVTEVKARFNLPFYMHRNEMKLLRYANLLGGVLKKEKKIRIPGVDEFIEDETPLRFGSIHLDVIETAGHSPGGVCFHVDNALFTGDTILNGRLGRVDLPGGDEGALMESVSRLAELYPEADVYPGHGEATTMAAQVPLWTD